MRFDNIHEAYHCLKPHRFNRKPICSVGEKSYCVKYNSEQQPGVSMRMMLQVCYRCVCNWQEAVVQRYHHEGDYLPEPPGRLAAALCFLRLKSWLLVIRSSTGHGSEHHCFLGSLLQGLALIMFLSDKR